MMIINNTARYRVYRVDDKRTDRDRVGEKTTLRRRRNDDICRTLQDPFVFKILST